jgi:hypothetical protein
MWWQIIYDAIMHMRDAKVLWDYLNATYGASDTGKELYLMESFHDYNGCKQIHSRASS